MCVRVQDHARSHLLRLAGPRLLPTIGPRRRAQDLGYAGFWMPFSEKTSSIALCSDIGPMLLPTSGGGMSGTPKLIALCLKQTSEGWSNFIDYRSRHFGEYGAGVDL